MHKSFDEVHKRGSHASSVMAEQTAFAVLMPDAGVTHR